MTEDVKFTLRMDRGWEERFLLNDEVRDLVALRTEDIATFARALAPRARTKPHWNTIPPQIESFVTAYKSWYGQVLIEPDGDVRHAMLQERGWTDRAGRRHPGRFYLKRALERARVE
ncbi:hypothetical protein AB0F36_07855 [Streptomyces sp. NPDC029080]|uniref:hypothetical protein n=1 Tax=Streptomyces sp. NPDC029080 TaxID=3155017 RepID=UPI0033FEFCB1